jgi:hypothetical protein
VPSPAFSFRTDIRAITVRLMAYLSGVGLLAIIAANLLQPESVDAAVEQVRPKSWIPATRPHPAFSLAAPELADKTISYDIFRHPEGGRKDIMAWDHAGQPFGQIEIYRPAGEQPVFGSVIGEVTRRAGVSSSERARAIGVVPTKFGLIQLVGFAALQGGEPRKCMGFAAPFESPRLQISGWFCQAGTTPPAPKLVICALDRLTLLTSGNDSKVAELFARAELRRGFCHPPAPSATADWVATLDGPDLRGSL